MAPDSKRRASIAQLGRQILAAFDRDDEARWRELIARMVEIAFGASADYPPSAVPVAVEWLRRHDGGAFDDILRRFLWDHPEVLVESIKAVRAYVKDPTTPGRKRRELERLLRQNGHDDESLRMEADS